MGEKFFTFLYFPGTHGKLRKVRMPYYVVQALACFCVVGMITVATLASTYTRMLFKVSTFNNLRSERESLKIQNRTLEHVVDEANAKVDSLQSLAAEVALTYGLGNTRRPRFPSAVLVTATGHRFNPEAGYIASMRAFNLLKTVRLISPRSLVLQGSLLDPLGDDSVTPSIWPVHGRVTAGFGQRMDPFTGEGAFHSGIDIAAPAGTVVRAAADGILFVAGPDAAYGTEVLIDHGYGITTKYGHLSGTSVVIGQEVQRGQVIGTVGMTGRSTGPHLHYEVRIYETAVNPATYLPGARPSRDGLLEYSQAGDTHTDIPAQERSSPRAASTGGQ
jgi:murein DD-endopeptidase MepM/ murein hydrolase activator NlpD